EVGAAPGEDQLFHILYDGTVVDESRFTALGGESDAITGRLQSAYRPDWPLPEALSASVKALAGPDRQLSPSELEVAVLDRSNGRRAFRRVLEAEVSELLAGHDLPPRPDGEGEDGDAAQQGDTDGTSAES